jgi:hypothetical protein
MAGCGRFKPERNFLSYRFIIKCHGKLITVVGNSKDHFDSSGRKHPWFDATLYPSFVIFGNVVEILQKAKEKKQRPRLFKEIFQVNALTLLFTINIKIYITKQNIADSHDRYGLPKLIIILCRQKMAQSPS